MEKQNDKRENQNDQTSNRGFASMDEDRQREIASKGGKASHGGGRKANASR